MSAPDVVEPRVAAWERRTQWWLTGLAVTFLVGYAWSVLDTSLTEQDDDPLEVFMTAVWAVFGLDYLVRLGLAQRRWRFVGTHLLDLVVLLLPMFRQLRVLRVIVAIGVLHRQLRDDVRGQVALYVSGTVALVGFVAALAVLDAERDEPGATIVDFGEAVWWTLTTVTTVGYGDRYPITFQGRLVATTLMIAGIALLGVVTASIASWFVANVRSGERVSQELQEVSQDVERAEVQLAEVLAELRVISARLDALERDRPA